MFLKKARKTYKDKVYETYSLTESYREGGRVKHRHIASLGSLSPEEAERIRLILKAKQVNNIFVGYWSDIVAKAHYKFLDVAVLDTLWGHFGLDDFFNAHPYAEALAINRCLDPQSKFQIRDWTEGTVLPRLVDYDFYTDCQFKIYRALDNITEQDKELQSHLYRRFKEIDITQEKAVFYDITSSYFEGTKCVLSFKGYSRDHRPDKEQITLGLVVTPKGYPFYWKVMPGNTQDVTTIQDLLDVLVERFGIDDYMLVFDRGMVSSDNLKAIAKKGMTYVSALDKDEISGLGFIEPKFSDLVASKEWQKKLISSGFKVYDQDLVYREYFNNKMRYILAFSHERYQEQNKNLKKRMERAESFLELCNEDLSQAKRSRNKKKIASKITKGLRKLRLHKVFDYKLEPLTLKERTKAGNDVNSFRVTYSINDKELKKHKMLHGITCFVTNQPKEKLSATSAIGYYRRKHRIEDAFRHIKDNLNLRPFHLTRKERVKAHVTICVLGYLLLNALEEKLKEHGNHIQGPKVLGVLGKCLINRIGLKGEDTYIESITEVNDQQEELLKQLSMEDLIDQKNLECILEYNTK